jgi:hypothetical protein
MNKLWAEWGDKIKSYGPAACTTKFGKLSWKFYMILYALWNILHVTSCWMMKFTKLFKELWNVYWVSFPGIKWPGLVLTTHRLLEPQLSMGRAISVLLSAPLLLLQVCNGTGTGYIQNAKWWLNIFSWDNISGEWIVTWTTEGFVC